MRRFLRWLRRISITLLLLLAVVLTFYFAALPSIVRRKAISAMEEAGIVGGDLRVSGLTPSRLDVTDLTLGPDTGAGIRAAALSAEFNWRELVSAGRVRSLDIIGAEWRIVVRGDRVDFGLPSAPPKPPSEKPADTQTPWPDRIRVRAASVVIDWDGREFRVPGEVSLTHQANEQWFVEARIDLPGAPVRIASTLGTPASGQAATVMPGAPASAPDEPVRLADAHVRVGGSKFEWNVTGGITSDRVMRFTATPAPGSPIAGGANDTDPSIRVRFEHGPIGSDKSTQATRPTDRVTFEAHWEHDGPLPPRLVEALTMAGIEARELGVVTSRGRVSASIARTSDPAGEPSWSWRVDADDVKLRVAGGNLTLGNRAITLDGLTIDTQASANIGTHGHEMRAFNGAFAVKNAAIHSGMPAFAKAWLASHGVDVRGGATLEANGEVTGSASLDASTPERSWRWAINTKGVTVKLSPSDIDVKPAGVSLVRFAGTGEFDGAFGSEGNTIRRLAADVHAERASREGDLPEAIIAALESAGIGARKLGKVALSATLDAAVSREDSSGVAAWKWDVSASKLNARVHGGDLTWGEGASVVRGLQVDLNADARLTQRSLTITNAAASRVQFTSASGGVGERAWSLVVPEASRAQTPKVNATITSLHASGDAFGSDMQKPATADVTIDTPVRFEGKGMVAELSRMAAKPELLVKDGVIVSLRATPRVTGGEFTMPGAQIELHGIAGDVPIAWTTAGTAIATTATATPRPTTQPANYADTRTGNISVASARVYGIELPSLEGRLGFADDTLLASAATRAPMLGAATPEARMWLDFAGDKPNGELWVNVPAFELKEPDALGTVLPAAKGVDVTGTVEAQLKLPFGDVKTDRLALIAVRDLTWARPKEKLEITGINGSLTITSFKPLVSEPAQSATIKKITLNEISLNDGRMMAELRDLNSILINEMTWRLSEGGTVATRDLLFTASKPTTNVPLEFRAASIRQLLGVLLGQRVEGQGEIDGFLPVRLTLMQDHLKVDLMPGKISAKPGKGGWVRIQGSKEVLDSVLGNVPADVGARTSEALSDFEYRDFVFEVIPENDDVVGRIQTAGKGRVGKKQEIGGLTINVHGLNDGLNEILKEYQVNPFVKRIMKLYGGVEKHDESR